jgi:hypothetical protein
LTFCDFAKAAISQRLRADSTEEIFFARDFIGVPNSARVNYTVIGLRSRQKIPRSNLVPITHIHLFEREHNGTDSETQRFFQKKTSHPLRQVRSRENLNARR